MILQYREAWRTCAVHIAGHVNAEAIECDEEEHEQDSHSLPSLVVRASILRVQCCNDGQANNATRLNIGQRRISFKISWLTYQANGDDPDAANAIDQQSVDEV